MKSKFLVFLIFIHVCQSVFGRPQSNEGESGLKESETLAESLVPEELEAEEIEPEDYASGEQESGAEGGESHSSVKEYLKEHPEIHAIKNDPKRKIKFIYNKYGDVVSAPDNSSETKSVPKQENKSVPKQNTDPNGLQQQMMAYQSAYQQMMASNPMNGYSQLNYPSMLPYYNNFGYNPFQMQMNQQLAQNQMQSQIQSQQMPLNFQPQMQSQSQYQTQGQSQPEMQPQFPSQQNQSPEPQPSDHIESDKPYGVIKVGETDPNLPEDVLKHFKEAESEDEELAGIIQAAEQAKANREFHVKETLDSQSTETSPDIMVKSNENEMRGQRIIRMVAPDQMQQMKALFPNMLFQPQVTQMDPNSPLSFDPNNMKVIPMSVPGGGYGYSDIMKKLKSGDAQLDMPNARIVPMAVKQRKKLRDRTSEAPTIEDFPEIPEVKVKKPVRHRKSKHKPKKSDKKSQSNKKQTKQEKPVELKKPTFILRARLNDLPKKNQKGKNQWWKRAVPDLCFDPIIEITECKKKKLEKRWSYNPEDQRCYLYEDYCAKSKKNTFKSLNHCMMTCWRPKD